MLTMRQPLVVVLAFAGMIAPLTSCRCSGSDQVQASDAGPNTDTPPTETLKETSFALPNGLKVDLVSGSCGDAAVLAVLVDVGIDHDPPERSGMARLAGRVLASSAAAGRAKRTVETGSEHTLYSVAADADHLLEELGDVAAWMSQTAPSEADLERERARLLEELSRLDGADAAATAVSLAEESVQPSRGNGKRLGIAAEVEAITLAELRAFWQAHFKPGNARIAVVGRFEGDEVRAAIETAFAPLASGTPPEARPPADATVKGTLVMGEAPTAVAVAVPAPPLSSPLYPAFLILAGRLLDAPSQGRTWEVRYDPISRPELLLLTGPVGPAEQPEPAASRIRGEVDGILARPLAAADRDRAKQRFQLLLEPGLVDPLVCAEDPRALARARARRPDLAEAPSPKAIDAVSPEQLEEARALFGTKRTAAVIAGGAIR